jgi:hypothetical protein
MAFAFSFKLSEMSIVEYSLFCAFNVKVIPTKLLIVGFDFHGDFESINNYQIDS